MAVPPPGAGLVTATCAEPTDDRSAATSFACSCVALTNVVVRGVPFQVMEEVETKPLPFTVSVEPASTVVTEAGETLVTWGAGLLIVNAVAAEVPPPGAPFTTVTCAVPAAARSAAVIAACNCVALTKVVARLL